MDDFGERFRESVDQAFQDLGASITRNGFGLLHDYDFNQTLKDKGFDLPNACRVLEVCNPKQACEVLHMAMPINIALPCRSSSHEENGKTFIGMIPPSVLLGGGTPLACTDRGVEQGYASDRGRNNLMAPWSANPGSCPFGPCLAQFTCPPSG